MCLMAFYLYFSNSFLHASSLRLKFSAPEASRTSCMVEYR